MPPSSMENRVDEHTITPPGSEPRALGVERGAAWAATVVAQQLAPLHSLPLSERSLMAAALLDVRRSMPSGTACCATSLR